MPLTRYVITARDWTLDISYTHVAPTETSIIELPLGNHSIDELVDVLNWSLIFGFRAAYSENTNALRFSSKTIGAALVVGPATTCVVSSGYAPETRASWSPTTRRVEST
jgi:hypothetical protein